MPQQPQFGGQNAVQFGSSPQAQNDRASAPKMLSNPYKPALPGAGRQLMVLTREQGVRPENPILTDKSGKYFLPSIQRTPALRKEADNLLKPGSGAGMKIVGKKVPK